MAGGGNHSSQGYESFADQAEHVLQTGQRVLRIAGDEMMDKKKAIIIIVVVILLLLAIVDSTASSKHKYSEYRYFNGFESSPRSRSTPRPTAAPAQRSRSQPSAGRRDITPSLSTDGFYSAEDFYEWNYDDFSDYEEAEDYYYEHGGY